MKRNLTKRLAAAAVTVGIVAGGTAMTAGPAFAAETTAARSTTAHETTAPDTSLDEFTRAAEVQYADTHWDWTAWNDSTPVAFGSAQPDFQCAEFVARSLASAGLIPGLGANDPQQDYYAYHAPNGKVYDLLLISPLTGYNNLYDYLMDSGIGQDLGDQPELAQPGDIVVTYLGANGAASHTGLVAKGATATSEPLVDAHNNARLDYGYHYYAPSHLIRLVPNAFLEVWAWAAQQTAIHGPQPTVEQQVTPHLNELVSRAPGMGDVAGPQV
jgi:hypothetical protein